MTTGYDVWLEEQHNNREVARLEVGGCMTTLVERLREAWKTSSENSLLISNAADEIERLNAALQWEQNRSERIGTHGPGCHAWGPAHYECLLRKFDHTNLRRKK